MKEQLNNITRELQEISTKELTKEEERKNNILYRKELHNFTNDLIIEEFEKGLQEKQTAKDIYNNLLLNDNDMKSYIINALYSYKIIITKKMTLSNGEIYKKEFFNYPFQDKDIYHDIEQIYYNTLKNIYNNYTLKNNIDNNNAIEELESLFYSYYKNYGYATARKTLFDEYNKNVIIEATDKNNQEYVKKNYTKILRQVDSNYKIANNEEIKQQEQLKKYQYTQSRPIIKKKKTFYAGSIVAGFIAGLLKVSKK